MSRHGRCCAFLVLLFGLAGSACSKNSAVKPEMLFMDARNLLEKTGWKPNDVHVSDGYEFIGVESKLRAANIIEVESCAMDQALCIFNYRNDNKCLRLVTQGEEINEMRIKSVSSDCPTKS